VDFCQSRVSAPWSAATVLVSVGATPVRGLGRRWLLVALLALGLSRGATPAWAQTLAYTQQPTNATAGVVISPAITVTATNAMAMPVANQPVTIAIGSGPAGGTLSGTATQLTNASGVATFNNLSLNKSGAYTFLATSSGFPNQASTSFTISPAGAATVAFATQPGSGSSFTAGTSITPLTVQVQDAFANNVADGTSASLTIISNPGGGTLSGTTTQTTVSGIASFNAASISIDKSGTGYVLRATSGAITANSNSFNIAPAAAASASFTVQPTTTTAGVAISTISVQVLDAFANTVANGTNVTMAIGANPGAGTLSGTTTQTTTSGIAQFGNLSINRTGTAYTLTATAGAAIATSAAFNINPASAASVSFSQQPSSAVAGVAIAPAITVTVLDAFGNNVANGTSVSMAIGNNPGGSTLSGTTTQTTISGVATFNNLSLNRTGTSYTLGATVGGLSTVFSNPFNITPAAAASVSFTTQPTSAVAGNSISPAVAATVLDAFGNTVANGTSVTVAIGTNPGSGTLSGTLTQTTTSGVATFGNLSLNRTGNGYTLTATVTGAPVATSNLFNITPGSAATVSFTVQPTSTVAGVSISPQVQVSVFDALGNLVGNGTNVTVAIGTNPGSGTLSGTTTQATVSGVASFNNLSINRTGTGYTLVASAAGTPNATSNTFNITPAAAASLSFTTQPTATVAGAAIAPAVGVTVLDAFGNAVANGTSVTVAIGTNPGGGTLSGTLTQTTTAGVASFNNLSINLTGNGYTLTATSAGAGIATSSAFNITPAAIASLSFTAQPSNTVAGSSISPAVQVTALDAFGNVVSNQINNLTIAIGANPGSGTLSGTTTVATSAGVAAFSTLSINRTGTGYTLVATATGATAATSAAFNINPGAAAQLAFSVQPSNATAGAAISPAVQITVQDALGNPVTTATNSVTVAIQTNPGGSTLSGTTSVSAVAGLATFSTLSLNRTGNGYTLAATSTGLTGTVSGAFNISAGTAAQLAFTVQPSNTTAGVSITPAVQVTVQDASGNTVPTATNSITVALGANPGGGTLSGTVTAAAASGVATFNNLSINRSGAGYTLTATSTGLTGATSAAFSIVAAAPAQLSFTVQPSNTTAGQTITPAVQVTVQDSFGNNVTTATNSVSLGIGSNPGSATLSGTTTTGAVAGVASFSNLSLNRSGTGYTLIASSAGLTSATSATFNLVAGAATQIAFGVQPATTTAGQSITPAVTLLIQDALGNTVTTATNTVTIAIGANPGGGTLNGTLSNAAVNGVATFNNLSINKSGTGYSLNATSTGLTGATSGAFNIVAGTPTQLVYTGQPGNTVAGASLTPAVVVQVQDALGNLVTGSTASITIAIGVNPGSGTLSGTTTAAASGGTATFNNLSINRTGTGYTLTATSAGLTMATSTAFNILPGAASQLAFTVQPTSTSAGATIAPAVAVQIQDALGNAVTTATNTVTLAIGNNPGSATLSGTVNVAAVGGTATFSTLSLNRSGTGYTLLATSAGLTGTTSAAFNVNAGTPAQLAFAVQPSNAVAGATIAPAITVQVQDAQGNLVTTATNTVAIAIGTNPGSGTLSGSTSVAAVSGVATFSNLTINRTGTGYTLTAAAGGLTGATSNAFNLNPGVAAQLAYLQQPSSAIAGTIISPPVQLQVQDALGNLVPTATNTVTLSIGTNPGGGTLGGTLSAAASGGVVSFGNLTINRQGTGYTLVAAAGGLSSATSAAFNITSGVAAQLAFTVQPANVTAGSTLAPAVQVTVQDGLGNTVTSATNTVSMTLNTGTLSGTTTVGAVAGVASFSNLVVNAAGAYTLTAASAGLASATSASFTVSSGTATALAFIVQPPASVTASQTLSPALQVAIRDSLGNTVSTATNNVTIAIGSNPGGGTLSGTLTVAAVNGIATFPTLSINLTGNGYTLTAAATGLTGATSTAFNVVPGTGSRLAFTVQPSNTLAGVTLAPAVQVTVQDANGNTVTSSTSAVTLGLGSNPGGSVLSGTTTVNAVSGVATFSNLSLNRVGTGYTLIASSPGVTNATSNGFNITAGTASQLVITVQPSNVVAGAVIAPAVQVALQDNQGNLVSTATNVVAVALGSNPGGAALSGSTSVAAVGGVATFNNLSMNRVANGYTLAASSTGLLGATSAAFNVTVGAPATLSILTQPSNATAGLAISPGVQISILDASGNLVTTAANTVSLAIGANPGSGTLGGQTSVAATSGVATFTNLNINRAGTGYTLVASSAGMTPVTTNAFNLSAGTATQLVFLVQPSNTVGGQSITPALQVGVQDSLGNTVAVPATSITIAIASNPAGGALSGTTTATTVNGVATFSNLSLNRVGLGYTLAASATGLANATSAPFNITSGAATQLVFTILPSSTAAGASITPPVQVTIQDALGNTVTGATNTVAIAIGTNGGGGTLSGTVSVAAVNGVATFGNLGIDRAGSYTLITSSTGLASATSASFTIFANGATRVGFVVQPASTTAGSTLSPAVQVAIQDALGNTVTTATNSVSIALGQNPGASTLSGTLTVNAVNGIASFGDLSLNSVGNGYTLLSSSPGLTGATSNAFNITAGSSNRLAFIVQPSNAVAGVGIAPAIQVAVQDGSGNTVTSSSAAITLALGANPGGGTLSGVATVNAINGVATFTGLSINRAGLGYTLVASAGALTSATSGTFNISAGGTSTLAVLTQPSNTPVGTPITPAVQVVVQDALGNIVSSATNSITLSLGTGSGTTLNGTTTVSAVSGVATFSNLSLSQAGTYTLVANAQGLSSVTTNGFNVTAATAARLTFLIHPSNTNAAVAMAPAVQVVVQDAFGNTVTTATNSITIALGANPGSSTLTGTLTASAVAGVASFSNLKLDKAGQGYTLTAAATGLTSATSNPFTITAAGTTRLAYLAPTPSLPNTNAGALLSPSLQIGIVDDNGNVVTTANNTVTIAIKNNAGSGTLSGAASVVAINGIATFNTLSIDKAGTGYTLEASSIGLTAVTTPAFNLVAGNAMKLGFVVQPVNVAAGGTLAAVQVAVQDQLGNTVTTATNNVTIALGSNPSGGTLGGTLTVTSVNGVATFSNLSIDKAGAGFTLVANATGMSGATSTSFSVTSGGATALAFTVQPTNTTAGLTLAAVQVAVVDAQGNPVTTATNSITMAIGTNPGGSTLVGTLTASAVNGVATFNDLVINQAGTGYTLRATAAGLTGANSAAFNIVTGVANKLGFVVQPTNTLAAAVINPAVQVAIQDSQGNTIASDTRNVTLAIGTNPGNGTLSGTLTVAAVNGVATFTGLSLNLIGTGYTLTATATNLSTATSNSFNVINANAARLAFIVQPANGTAGQVLVPAVQIAVQDANGNTVTTATNAITIALGSNPSTATLTGTLTANAVNGVATFNNLSLNLAGANYTLTATAGGLTGAVSTAFTLVTAAPTVTAISPNAGANNLTIGVQITGTDFQGGTTVKLTRTGQADKAATNVVIVNSTTINATLDLNGLATGVWNVVVTRLDGQTGTLANGFTVNAPVGKTLSLGLAGNAVSLVSLPDVPAGFDPFAGFLDRNRNSALARWNPLKANDAQFAKYEFLIDGGTTPGLGFTTVENGRGYWRKGSSVFTSNFISRTTTFDLPVFAGTAPFANWNIVGLPYTSAVELSSLQVITGNTIRTFGEAVTAGLVSDFVWTYPVTDGTKVTSNGYQLISTLFPSALTKLSPGSGYWMAFTQDSTLRYNPPTTTTQRTLSQASLKRQVVGGDHWMAQLRVRSGDHSDDYNFFGTSQQPRALLKPPAAPEGSYVALTFVEPSRGDTTGTIRHAAALRSSAANARNEWEFVVETNLDREVELSWPDLGSAPKDLAFYITDVETGRRVYMRTQAALAFRPSGVGPRRFRISAEPRGAGALAVRDMAILNSSARASTLNFVLSQHADLELRVISPSGKLVNNQTLLNQRVGLNSVTIHHQDGRGYVLPRGFYLVEVTATSPEGQIVKGLKGFALK